MFQKTTFYRTLLIAIAVTGFATACASTSEATPESMSAKSHEEAAAEHAQKADEASQSRYAEVLTGSDFAFQGTEFDPNGTHNVQAQKHRRHAEAHMAAAEELRNAEEEACASVAPESRSWCPLLGPVAATEDTPNGVRILIKEGTNVEEMVARIRCHIAYANEVGRKGMERCPLYVEGVEVEQTGPRTVELRTEGKGNVRELQKRVAEHTGG